VSCRKDTNGVIRALVELGVITPTGDMLSIRRAISYFLDNITRQTERQETVAVRPMGEKRSGLMSGQLTTLLLWEFKLLEYFTLLRVT
jgi:predicted unusual protein kinase regulating ubiquinone biosynthesis (AarF/ABC1/UbiB family)